MAPKIIKYPENIPIRKQVYMLDLEIQDLAEKVGRSRVWISRVLAGHEKGSDTIEKIQKIIRDKESEAK